MTFFTVRTERIRKVDLKTSEKVNKCLSAVRPAASVCLHVGFIKEDFTKHAER